jgi:hypothetical protein
MYKFPPKSRGNNSYRNNMDKNIRKLGNLLKTHITRKIHLVTLACAMK